MHLHVSVAALPGGDAGQQSLTVTYQGWRGEPRLRGRRHDGDTGGDCIDCGACVTACPTGIDIRDGIQLECISCGLCVDACNHVMAKTRRPRWLITWDTLADQAAKARGEQTSFRLFRVRAPSSTSRRWCWRCV